MFLTRCAVFRCFCIAAFAVFHQIFKYDTNHFKRWLTLFQANKYRLLTLSSTKVAILGAYLVSLPNRLTYHLTLIYTWTSVQISDKRFCLQNRFTFICVSYWCIECYECLYCAFPKEDSSSRTILIFIKEKSKLLRFVFNFRMSILNKIACHQTAVKLSDASSDWFLYFQLRVKYGEEVLRNDDMQW